MVALFEQTTCPARLGINSIESSKGARGRDDNESNWIQLDTCLAIEKSKNDHHSNKTNDMFRSLVLLWLRRIGSRKVATDTRSVRILQPGHTDTDLNF